MAKVEYIRCPRCELNYIDKKEHLCKVCQMEMSSKRNSDELEEDMELGICPVCKTNYIGDDEDICPACAKEKEIEEDMLGIQDESTSWRMYVENEDTDEDEDLGDMASITDMDDDMLDDSLGLELDIDDEELDDLEDSLDEDDLDDYDDYDDDDDYDDLDEDDED